MNNLFIIAGAAGLVVSLAVRCWPSVAASLPRIATRKPKPADVVDVVRAYQIIHQRLIEVNAPARADQLRTEIFPEAIKTVAK
tara:strand:+ start:4275 stop:4523 length:249 start_codon:yes stop_codon:yes gene_type:complete